MLSKGYARKFVTNKDSQGRSVIQEIIVEGPVTTAIPTVRNKTDDQLQSRLLVAELVDYPGRVKAHSAAVSELLHPDYAVADHSHRLFLWREGLRQLTEVRRVVSRVKHPDFALDDDQVSHGARLWANLMGLMSTHAWLEQRNREISALASGERAIVASPEDYEAAYNIFTEVCQRTIVNLSEIHRKILGALYGLRQEFPNREGFPQREIAKAARVSLGTISNNKTFLATSVKLIKETEHGLALVEGAEPSWWEGGDKIMTGLPTPEQVRAWWQGHDPPPGGAEHAEHAEHVAEAERKAHTYAGNGVQCPTEHPMSMFSYPEDDPEHPTGTGEHVQPPFTEAVNTENGTGKPKTGDAEEVFSVSRGSGDDDPHNDEGPGMEF
jgi:hypothetical protein